MKSEVPADFREEAQRAMVANDRAHLILLSLECEKLGWESAGKKVIEEALTSCKQASPVNRVVLFTGHRIDEPGRESPRFPAESEAAVASSIEVMLAHEKQEGPLIGIAGAANGGDILFLEACGRLGVPFQVRLALPEDQFESASVATKSPGDWVGRFQSLVHRVTPQILAQSKELPKWLETKPDYSFWERNNLWLISSALALQPEHFVLMALWDGQTGDGAGGTQHMVEVAQQHGAQFLQLDIKKIIRSAGQ